MRQREIWLADLNPVKGSEQSGIRPVVIISGNAMNDHLGISIVCPLTTKIKGFAGCVIIEKGPESGLEQDSEILTFQIRSIAGSRLIRKLGEISSDSLSLIRNGLLEVLTY
ncbi:MAG: type II toxin-antitoxin system PemK/MazF family toxin [Bacteroidetes bacterium]|nr:type II toxin-antitoxin system PemK/MazF family toxin [Bacteroidota bacterium]